MPSSKTLPCVMCTSCKNYGYSEQATYKHICYYGSIFESDDKIGQDPDRSGTAYSCKSFQQK